MGCRNEKFEHFPLWFCGQTRRSGQRNSRTQRCDESNGIKQRKSLAPITSMTKQRRVALMINLERPYHCNLEVYAGS